MNIYDFKLKTIDGEEISAQDFKNKVLIIVNTASKCGFTPQYEDLQKLYDKYNDKGLEILGFPCDQFAGQEPGNNLEVKNFCKINYGVTFKLFEKIEVRGENTHPLFKYLIKEAPFKGFDMSLVSSKILHSFLQEKFPEYLIGNSVKWNFTKFLIDRNGNVVERFESPSDPLDMIPHIERIL